MHSKPKPKWTAFFQTGGHAATLLKIAKHLVLSISYFKLQNRTKQEA